MELHSKVNWNHCTAFHPSTIVFNYLLWQFSRISRQGFGPLFSFCCSRYEWPFHCSTSITTMTSLRLYLRKKRNTIPQPNKVVRSCRSYGRGMLSAGVIVQSWSDNTLSLAWCCVTIPLTHIASLYLIWWLKYFIMLTDPNLLTHAPLIGHSYPTTGNAYFSWTSRSKQAKMMQLQIAWIMHRVRISSI